MNSRIVIGDVHGCYKTLIALMEKFPKDIPVTFAGDLVDRGPDSHAVVKFVKDGGYDCVKGNHEDMMIVAYHEGEKSKIGAFDHWFSNGGVQTMFNYNNFPEDQAPHVEWMENLPFYIEYPEVKNDQGRYLVVSHAGIGPQWKNRNVEHYKHSFRDTCLWNRDKFEDVSEIYNIHGHTPQMDVRVKSFYANVDTGACFKNRGGYGRLSAIQWPENIIYTQENID